MVNKVKVDELGQPGGAFYINEYRDVLVPDGRGGPCFWAGNYEDDELEFEEGSLFVTPRAPDHLEPGEPWPGPHVGIPYVLSAGALEIRYENVDGRRRETVLLSDFVPPSASRALATRLGQFKGQSGGRFFINECAEIFAPVGVAGDWSYVYLGDSEDDAWFPAPGGFKRV